MTKESVVTADCLFLGVLEGADGVFVGSGGENRLEMLSCMLETLPRKSGDLRTAIVSALW
jgi:hypothetical protein